MLATDMLTHGYDGNMEKAILLAGDLDFRPIIEALVRRGVLTEIWFEPKSAAKELPGAADFGFKIHFHQLWAWSNSDFQVRCRMPDVVTSAHMPDGRQYAPVREGYLNGRTVTLFQGNGLFLIRSEGPAGVLAASHDDVDVLVRYFDVIHGTVNWERMS